MSSRPIVGAEELAAGHVNRHQLRTRFRRILPGVYLDKTEPLTIDHRIEAAWLWSKRRGVIAGSAASHLLGAKWVDADVAVDVVIAHGRPPSGVRCRKDNLSAGEVTTMYGIDVTTAPRTAFDIARCGPVGVAVMRLDALMNATGVKSGDVEGVVAQHPGARGLRQLETVLALADFGAESPKETSLRLLLRRAGLPAPQTQIEVRDDAGALLARLDMGWPEFMVAVEYDGDQHRHDRRQYVRDVRRLELLEQLGWIVIRVVKEDSPTQIVRRVVAALERRGSRLH